MQIFYVLVTAWILIRGIGALGVERFDDWIEALRGALAVMFFVTASAHWGKRRQDLIRMVPFQQPGKLVTLTGIFEILGAIGLLLPSTTRTAAWCLAFLLIALFPANVYAARRNLSIGSTPVTPLPLRTGLQAVYIAALVTTAIA